LTLLQQLPLSVLTALVFQIQKLVLLLPESD
jgi:hypothetical protein